MEYINIYIVFTCYAQALPCFHLFFLMSKAYHLAVHCAEASEAASQGITPSQGKEYGPWGRYCISIYRSSIKIPFSNKNCMMI